MNIDEKFRELKDKREGGYMAHIYYGDPTENFSVRQIETLARNGADFIEFGIPFSDPTADGPTFQAACERALAGGMTPSKCISGIRKLRERGLKTPIIVTTYYNILYFAGVENFTRKLERAGAQAIIVPNVPVEDAAELLDAGRKAGIHVVFQVAPTTTEDRLKKIVEAASGFLYVINVEGVTGVRSSLAKSTLKLVTRVRRHTDMPTMAGFGISRKEHAAAVVAAGADGAITGSALGKIYEKNLRKPEATLPKIASFSRQIKKGCVDGYRKRVH